MYILYLVMSSMQYIVYWGPKVHVWGVKRPNTGPVCTPTNATPDERFFSFSRRSTSGRSLL